MNGVRMAGMSIMGLVKQAMPKIKCVMCAPLYVYFIHTYIIGGIAHMCTHRDYIWENLSSVWLSMCVLFCTHFGRALIKRGQ